MMTERLEDDELRFMLEAFAQANDALVHGEVPVGCTFIFRGEIVGKGRNTVNETRNATRHAEMNCVDQVLAMTDGASKDHQCNKFNVDRSYSLSNNEMIDVSPLPQRDCCKKCVFSEIDVYVTVEPCAMCADALGQLGVRSVTYGCSNDRFGGCGSVVDVPALYGYKIKFRRDVQKEMAVQLLKEFYKGENPNAPTGKAKRKQLK